MIITQKQNTINAKRVLENVEQLVQSGKLTTREAIEAEMQRQVNQENNPVEKALAEFITRDELMERQKGRIRLMVRGLRTDPVLISGPTGTGKELFARAFEIRGRPFIARNCAALPESLIESLLFGHKRGAFTGANTDYKGILEQAGSGVVFLDEIGDMPPGLQPKLLRAMQERVITPIGGTIDDDIEISCRFVFATKHNMEDLVNAGKFRDDLYARISMLELVTTGLIQRPDDIDLIFKSMIYRPDYEADPLPPISDSLRARIYRYNVRAIQKAVLNLQLFGTYE